MLQFSKFKWSILVMVLHFIVLAYFMVSLPADAKIPMHWNINNEIDGWGTKTGALAFNLAFGPGMFLLMLLLPLYSPWYRKSAKRYESFVPALTFVLLLFFALINIYSLYLAYSGVNPQIQFILILMGLLFIFLGNLLPKAPRNFFIGIKTPWTLADDEVWQKTHRLGGKFFVLSGLILIVKGLVLTNHNTFQQISGAIAMIILLYPLLYSLIIYKAKHKTT